MQTTFVVFAGFLYRKKYQVECENIETPNPAKGNRTNLYLSAHLSVIYSNNESRYYAFVNY
jgi:hypothetical protein